VIMTHTPIGQMACSFHGTDGISIPGNGKRLGETVVRALFTTAPKVEKIAFMSCNVVKRPTQMVAFAKIFGAENRLGIDVVDGPKPLHHQIAHGMTEADIRKPLNLRRVLDRGAAGCERAGISLHVAYESPDQARRPLRLRRRQRIVENSHPLRRDRKRKQWKDARKKMISAKDAESAEREYQPSPVATFEFVTITM
jgi:hypothetical protein